jgi:hypothetical protein
LSGLDVSKGLIQMLERMVDEPQRRKRRSEKSGTIFQIVPLIYRGSSLSVDRRHQVGQFKELSHYHWPTVTLIGATGINPTFSSAATM